MNSTLSVLLETITCSECNDSILFSEIEEYTTVGGDAYICNSCISEWSVCEECDRYTHNNCIRTINHTVLCEDCYDDATISCEWCGEVVYNSDARNFQGDYICERCWENNTFYCESCGEQEHNDNYGGDGYCSECYHEDDYDNSDYEYRGWYNFYKLAEEPAGSMYYGIELETGTLEHIDFEGEIIDNLPTKYFNRHSDCSIFDDCAVQGVEIVGHPMTYKWMKKYPNVWNNVLKLRRKGLRSYDAKTCGIHIHLSKDAFTEKHLYKFMKMIYGFQAFTTLISQRRQGALRQWANLKGDGDNLKKKAKDKYFSKRYTAVNLSNHRGTVEVRLFRGTLNEMAFWKNIEYIQALVEFTKQAKVKELSLKNFISYICAKKTEFCNLYNWLKKKNKIKE